MMRLIPVAMFIAGMALSPVCNAQGSSITLAKAKQDRTRYLLVYPVREGSPLCLRTPDNSLRLLVISAIKGKRLRFASAQRGKFKLSDEARKRLVSRCDKQMQRLTRQCAPRAESFAVQVAEGGSVTFTLQGVDPCAEGLTYRVVSTPQEGILSGGAPTLSYQAAYRPQTLTYVVSNSFGESPEAQVALAVVPSVPGTEFRGVSDDLRPYANLVTESEVRHLLDKVAFGGSEALVSVGLTQGLDALVDTLLNAMPDAATVMTEQVVGNRYRDLYCVTQERSKPTGGSEWVNFCNSQVREGRPLATYRSEANRWLHGMRYGSPLREKLALLWHDHFAIDLSAIPFSSIGRRNYIENHVSLIRKYALDYHGADGGWQTFLNFANAMHFDGAMNAWLDNFLNTYSENNENYGREVTELFLLGQHDPITGARNYSEEDILTIVRSFAGFLESNVRVREDQFEVFPTSGSYPSIFINPFTISLITFAPGRWMPRPDNPESVVLFPGTIAEGRAPFRYDTLTEHILRNHPGSARYLSSKLFAQLVHPEPSDRVVASLAQDWVSSNFSVRETVRQLLRSSAMFSAQAKDACVLSPLEFLISLTRRLDLPTASSDGSFDFYDVIRNSAGRGGDALLQKPTVFGVRGCGVNRDGVIARGEVWLSPSQLLERRNGVTEYLNSLNRNAGRVGFSWRSLLPLGDAARDPGQVVSVIAKRLGVVLTSEQMDQLVRYLVTVRDRTSNGDTVVVWDPTNNDLVTTKVAGLVEILSTLPQANRA